MKYLKLFLLAIILLSFSIVNAQWVQQAGNLYGNTNEDTYGSAVCINNNGQRLAVGSPHSDEVAGNSGSVRVYDLDTSGTLTQIGGSINGNTSDDFFGSSVAISDDGNTIIVGAPNNNAGYVKIYQNNSDIWELKGTIINGVSSGDSFGTSVDISNDGNTIIVGAPNYDNSSSDEGEIVVYYYNGSDWALKGTQIYGDSSGDKLGTSVSISPDGNNIVVGAPYSDADGTNGGQAKIYHYNGSDWSQVGYNILGGGNSDNLGVAVSISSDGNSVALGSPGSDSGRGKAEVYNYSNNSWSIVGVSILGINTYDYLGKTINLSGEGNVLAVGITGADLNGGSSGQVKVFKYDNGNWIQRGIELNGDASGSSFGSSLWISEDANYVIAGAPYDDTQGTDKGQVKIFKWNSSINSTCLIAEYPLDNITGTTAEDVIGTNDAQTYGTVLMQNNRFNEPNNAIGFDGSDDFIIVPNGFNNLAGGAFSIWINIADTTNLFPIFTKNLDTDMWADLKVEHGEIIFTLQTTSTISSTIKIGNNTWHNIIGLWYDTSMELYLDGALQAQGTILDGGLPDLTGSDLVLGNDASGNTFANGIMDEFKIFDCPIEENEINEIYHDNDWNLFPFEDQCEDLNNNLVPEHYILKGDTAFIDNARFMVGSMLGDHEPASLQRLGTMPTDLDSVVVSWDSQVLQANELHFTGLGVQINDTSVYIIHNQGIDYDYGSFLVGDDNGPIFLKNDSSYINTGLYKNIVVFTNENIIFTSYKLNNENIVPFTIEFNPFQLDSNYSIANIKMLEFTQMASENVGYNWMDNLCIDLEEQDPNDLCKVAVYNFNKNLADVSGNGYHLHAENGPVTYVENRFGIPDKALHLTGNNGGQEPYTLTIPEELINDVSVSTWVKPDEHNGTDTCLIFSNYIENGGEIFMLGYLEASGQIFYGHTNDGQNLQIGITNFSIPTNVWSNIIVSRNSNDKTYTLYYNSDSIGSYTYNTQPFYDGTSIIAYAISSSESNFNYEGDIDGTRVWRCMITPDQVDSIYHVGNWPQVMCNDLSINIAPYSATCGDDNGYADVIVSGGSGIYNITWSNGDEGSAADSLIAGMHSVQVTDSIYGCMINQFFNINNAGAPSISFTNTNNDCFGDQNGEIDAGISGGNPPYTIEWSNGETTHNIDHLSSGNYFITVLDASGCMVTSSTLITEPSEILVSFDITNSSCGNSDGKITVLVSGGEGPYTYQWSTGGTLDSIYNIPAGSYTVSVHDVNGCQGIFTTGFSDSGSPIAMVDSTTSANCNELGNLYVSVSGGSGAYGYEWSNGETNEDLVGFAPGDYWLTVTDGNCMTMLNANIPFNYPQNQELCVVTVDPTTTTNLVVWEKVQTSGIDHYNIYREGFVADDYQLVDTVLFNDMSEFTDPIANPVSRSWKYKISAEDACGNESTLSDAHKTIHLNINLALGGNINLIWDDYEGFEYTTFYINRHTSAEGWITIDSLPTYIHSYTDSPTDLYGLWYSVTVASPGQCVPTSLNKASGGPYYQSSSNIEDEGAIDTKTTIISDNYKISLFPNPNNGRFMIGLEKTVSGSVTVLDISGKVVLLDQFIDQNKWVNNNILESGVYLIKIKIVNNGTQIMKMIVE